MESIVNILDLDHRRDPYPDYARLRREGRVVRLDPGGMWAFTRYEDALAVLKNPEIFSSSAFKPAWEPAWLGYNPLAHSMLAMDPPRHTRLRNLVSRAFGPRVVSRLESTIRAIAEKLADDVLSRGEVDFAEAFAMPLPGLTICEMMGLDPSMRHNFKRWTDAATSGSPVPPAPEVIADMRRSLEEQCGYLREVIAARRSAPRDDLVTDLIRAEVEGQLLTEVELVEFLSLLLAAGFETTGNLLGMASLRLSTHPEEMRLLRDDPALIPKYVDEMTRYDSSIQTIPRLTTGDTEIAGVRIPAGSLVLALVGSANRDESRYPDPDRFDIHRGEVGLGFGHGNHFCIGMALARAEMRIGIETIVSRFRALELGPGPIPWKVALTLRGLNALPVRAVAC